MLTDPMEIAIISRARQVNVRDPRRSRAHFDRIFNDFLKSVSFPKSKILDLGPGQWDFGVLARECGAEIWGVDNDPAVIELGRRKGFDAMEGDLRQPSKLNVPAPFDGLFCKFSINAFWAAENFDAQRQYVSNLLALARPDAWIWISPWNGVPTGQLVDAKDALAWQKAAFEEHGCNCRQLSRDETAYYGVNGNTANSIVFTREL